MLIREACIDLNDAQLQASSEYGVLFLPLSRNLMSAGKLLYQPDSGDSQRPALSAPHVSRYKGYIDMFLNASPILG